MQHEIDSTQYYIPTSNLACRVPYLCTFVLFVEEIIYQLIALADQLTEFVRFCSSRELLFAQVYPLVGGVSGNDSKNFVRWSLNR